MNLRYSERAALVQIKEYITAHCAEKLTVKDLSDRFWYDPVKANGDAVLFHPIRLQKAFKLSFLHTIHEYQTYLRMKKAKLLLSGTDQSVKEISISVGYATTRKFARVFKNHFSVTPSEYRQRIIRLQK